MGREHVCAGVGEGDVPWILLRDNLSLSVWWSGVIPCSIYFWGCFLVPTYLPCKFFKGSYHFVIWGQCLHAPAFWDLQTCLNSHHLLSGVGPNVSSSLCFGEYGLWPRCVVLRVHSDSCQSISLVITYLEPETEGKLSGIYPHNLAGKLVKHVEIGGCPAWCPLLKDQLLWEPVPLSLNYFTTFLRCRKPVVLQMTPVRGNESAFYPLECKLIFLPLCFS